MRAVHDRGRAGAPPPEADALIEEARRRARRRRRAIAALVALAVGLGIGLGFGFSGPGGGGVHGSRGAGGGRGGSGAPGGGSGSARVVVSAPLPPYEYRLAVQGGRIAVVADYGECDTRLLDPRTLHVESIRRRCAGSGTLSLGRVRLVVDFGAADDRIRVATTNPTTHASTVGPVLITLPAWSWAHSGVAGGDGALWIYGLGGATAESTLLEVSTRTGALVHRFAVAAGDDPFMVVDADGFWITESAWGGSSCSGRCMLWHVAAGSDRLVAARSLGVRTQWLVASGHRVYADVLTGVRGGYRQTLWRLDGPSARIAYERPATLLPSTDFAPGTGYVVVGDGRQGYFTITQLGRGTTPAGVGGCDTAAPIRVVGIDPATGGQRYVATLPPDVAGSGLDCHLSAGQAVFYRGSLYLLAGERSALSGYQRVVRVAIRSA